MNSIYRKFNGEPLKIDGENIKVVQTPEGSQCLLIEKVNKDNTGEYELVATNDIGENSTKAQLTVSCMYPIFFSFNKVFNSLYNLKRCVRCVYKDGRWKVRKSS